jgi:hypothetical protein
VIASLLSTVAWPTAWSGDFHWWHTPAELRAFGLSWDEIEASAMSRPDGVRWD